MPITRPSAAGSILPVRAGRCWQQRRADFLPSGPAGLPVPTENLIRGGADPAMGYLRVGMLDLLKRLGGFLAGLFRSQAAREAEMAFLRQQLLVLKRSAPARSGCAQQIG